MKHFVLSTLIAFLGLCGTAQAQWEKVPGPEIPTIGTFIETGDYLFAAVLGNENNCMVYRSQNDGYDWEPSSIGIYGSENLGFVHVGETLYLCTDKGLFKSDDLGSSWSLLHVPIFKYITRIAADNSNIYICGVPIDTHRYHFYASQDGGSDWSKWSVISNALFRAVAAMQGHVYTCFPTDATFYDYHPDYSENKKYITIPGACRDLLASEGNLVAASSDGVYISSNHGKSWASGGLKQVSLEKISVNGTYMAALSSENRVFATVEGTHIWKELPSTFSPGPAEGLKLTAVCATSSGAILVAVEGAGLYRWDAIANLWVHSSDGMASATAYQIETIGNVLFVATGKSGIYRSSNSGSDWEPVNTGFNDQRIYGIDVDNTDMYAATWRGDNWKSTDLGKTWEYKGNSSTPYSYTRDFWIRPHMLAYKQGVLHNACTIGSVRSSDDGTTWTVDSRKPNYIRTKSGKIFYGTNLGIDISSNNGISWKRLEPIKPDAGNCAGSGGEIYAFDLAGDVIIAGGERMFLSTDAGGFWTGQLMPDGEDCEVVLEIEHIVGETFLVSFGSGHVYRTLDNAGTWQDYSQGLPDHPRIRDFHRLGDYVYAADEQSGLWRRAINETTSKRDPHTPLNVALSQNYPNPVSGSTTTIRYSLPAAEYITLTVTNALGQTVARLVGSRMESGTHSIPFNAEGLMPGVYFYTLRSGNTTQTRSMLLTR